MKKPIFMIFAILTVSCAACLAGCAKSPEKNSGISGGNGQRITVTDGEQPDGGNTDNENPPERECPDGRCGRRGPHTGYGGRYKLPVGENFTFIIEINPDCRFKKRCPEEDKPDAPETLPSPEEGENNTGN